MLLIDQYPEHKDLIQFIDHCDHVKSTFELAKLYLETDFQNKGIDRELRQILVEYSYLQIAQLIDPPESFDNRVRRKVPNFSIHYFLQVYDIGNCNEAKNFLETNKDIISSLKNARNKAIAHLDLLSIQEGRLYPGFSLKQAVDFFESLSLLLNKFYTKAQIDFRHKWDDTFIQRDFDIFKNIMCTGIEYASHKSKFERKKNHS